MCIMLARALVRRNLVEIKADLFVEEVEQCIVMVEALKHVRRGLEHDSMVPLLVPRCPAHAEDDRDLQAQ